MELPLDRYLGLPFSKRAYGPLPWHDRVRVSVPCAHVHDHELCVPCSRVHDDHDDHELCVPCARVHDDHELCAPCVRVHDDREPYGGHAPCFQVIIGKKKELTR